jgi:hypothetical protein
MLHLGALDVISSDNGKDYDNDEISWFEKNMLNATSIELEILLLSVPILLRAMSSEALRFITFLAWRNKICLE